MRYPTAPTRRLHLIWRWDCSGNTVADNHKHFSCFAERFIGILYFLQVTIFLLMLFVLVMKFLKKLYLLTLETFCVVPELTERVRIFNCGKIMVAGKF